MEKIGSLRVWWIPQVPGKPFRVPVKNIEEAKKLLDTLAKYDIFQYENRIKGDYCNAGGLEVVEVIDEEEKPQGEWVEWSNEDGQSIDEVELG
jgi:hypothetical protein